MLKLHRSQGRQPQSASRGRWSRRRCARAPGSGRCSRHWRHPSASRQYSPTRREATRRGGVEHLVRWMQQNPFRPVPEPEVDWLEELNALLLRRCLENSERHRRDGRLVADRWTEEHAHQAALPAAPFLACRRRFARVDKTVRDAHPGRPVHTVVFWGQRKLPRQRCSRATCLCRSRRSCWHDAGRLPVHQQRQVALVAVGVGREAIALHRAAHRQLSLAP